jgi:large subunit ribosomal protein L35
MPKLKSNSGAKKRFKFTKTGKVKRKRATLRHILTSKTNAQKRRLSTSALVAEEDLLKMRRLLPYG